MESQPTQLEARDEAAVWSRRSWWLLVGVFLWRAGFQLFFIQSTDLAGDEAYYWDWGRQLDWGYFSKPPFIAWLMAGVSALSGGGTEWAIRFAALAICTGSLGLLFLLVRSLTGAQAGFWTLVLVVLTPANLALHLFLTIDAPLVFWWTLSLLLLWKAAHRPDSIGLWIALGVSIGLGVLSKQMMLVFPALMLLWAGLDAGKRALLVEPGFWISMLLGCAFLLPVLWWNQNHGWITLEHTKHHFNADAQNFGDHLSEFFQFPGIQALLYTPLTWILLMAVLYQVWRGWKRLPAGLLFIALFSALPLPAFYLLALRQEVNPNWPAVFYIGVFILAGAWLAGHTFFPPLSSARRKAVLVVAAVVTLTTHVLPVVIDLAGWRGKEGWDPLADLRGWNEAGQQAGAVLDSVPRPEKTFVVALGHRYNAAHMAFEMPQRPRLYRWEPDGSVMSQYEVWEGPEKRLGWDALVIYPSPTDGSEPRELAKSFWRHFSSHRVVGEIHVEIGNGRGHHAQLWLCEDMQRWPPPVQIQAAEREAALEAARAARQAGSQPEASSP